MPFDPGPYLRLYIAAAGFWLLLGIAFGTDPNNIEWQFLHMHQMYAGFIAMMIFAAGQVIIPWAANVPLRWPVLMKLHFWLGNLTLLGLCLAWSFEHHPASYSRPVAAFAAAHMATIGLFIVNVAVSLGPFYRRVGNLQRPSFRPPSWARGKPSVEALLRRTHPQEKYLALFTWASLAYLAWGLFFLFISPPADRVTHIVHVHFMEIGFVLMFLFAIGYFVLPKFTGTRLRWPELVGVHFWLANITFLGLMAAWLVPPLVVIQEFAFYLFAFGFCFGNLLFVLNVGTEMWREMRRKIPSGLSRSQRKAARLEKYKLRFILISFAYLLFLFLSTGLGGVTGNIGWQFAHAHLLDMGFVSVLLYVLGYFVFPAFTRRPVPFTSFIPVHFWLGPAMLWGFAVMWKIHIYDSAFNMVINGFGWMESNSMLLYAALTTLGALLPEGSRLSAGTQGEFSEATPLKNLLDKHPQAWEVLASSGLTALRSPVQRQYLSLAGTSLGEVCLRHKMGVDPVLARYCQWVAEEGIGNQSGTP